MNNKLGDPAFPTLDKFYPEHGMSLRDYFAAKAMQSLIIQIYNPEYNSAEDIAKWSYEFADAMIRESQKK